MINLKPIGNYLHTKKYYFTASIPYIYPPSLVLSMYIIICNKNVGYEIWYGYWVFINFIHNTIHEHDSSRDGHPPCLLQCRRCVQLLRLLLFHRRQEPPLQPCCRPTIIELDRHASGSAILAALCQLSGETRQPLPAVFVGGKLLGGVEILLAKHINGALIPLLKEAGALWLWLFILFFSCFSACSRKKHINILYVRFLQKKKIIICKICNATLLFRISGN